MKPLLDNYIHRHSSWDEMFTDKNEIRSVYTEFGRFLEKASIKKLNQMHDFSREFFMNQGVTFTVYNNKKGVV